MLESHLSQPCLRICLTTYFNQCMYSCGKRDEELYPFYADPLTRVTQSKGDYHLPEDDHSIWERHANLPYHFRIRHQPARFSHEQIFIGIYLVNLRCCPFRFTQKGKKKKGKGKLFRITAQKDHQSYWTFWEVENIICKIKYFSIVYLYPISHGNSDKRARQY